MRKSDLSVPALLLEAVTLILAIAYLGLQIFYGIYYHRGVLMVLLNAAVILLVYVGLILLSIYPERVNRLSEEVCQGDVRKYTIRMLRIEKFVFVAGLLIPSIFDVLGSELHPASSVVLIGLLILIPAYYEFRIIRKLKERD